MPIAAVLADKFTMHDLNLSRFATGEREKIRRMLDGLRDQLLLKLDQQVDDGMTFSRRRLQALFKVTDLTIDNTYAKIAKVHDESMLSLAEVSANKSLELVNKTIGVSILNVGVPESVLKAMVKDDISLGLPAAEWWDGQGTRLRQRFQNTIRQGVFAGETLSDLKRRVRGRRENGFKDGIMVATSRDAEALIRTSVNSIAQSARMETFKANDDVVKGVQWLSTLDLRTTPQCQALSGQAWTLDGEKLEGTELDFPGPPPIHFNALAGGTLISTMSGQKPIEDVCLGEWVLTHRGRWRRVYATMSKCNDSGIIRRLHTNSGRVLLTTDEHPMLTFSKGWQSAGDLKPGDQVFEYSEQSSKSGLSIAPFWLPNEYPSPLDEKRISYDVASLAIFDEMISPICFKQNHRLREREIGDIAIDWELKHKVGESDDVQRINDSAFIASGVRSESFGKRNGHASSNGLIVDGIVRQHAFAMSTMNGGRGLGHPICPMPISARSSGSSFGGTLPDGYGIQSGSLSNPVLITPKIQTRWSNPQRSFNGANRFLAVDMPDKNQLFHNGAIGQVDHHTPFYVSEWTCSTILSIAELAYKGRVYNLGVEEDETYLAEGIIVHNCRSSLIPAMKSWGDLIRDAKGDKDLAKRMDAMEEKLPKSTQASMDGQVSSAMNYEQWLERQPEGRQIEALGEGKWELWKKGDIALTDLIDTSGRPLSLKDLEAL